MDQKKYSKLELIKKKTLELALVSSAHGVPNIFRTNKFVMKIVWAFLFIIFSAISFYTVALVISNYLNLEKVTKIEIKYEKNIQFPAITFSILKDQQIKYLLKIVMSRCVFDNIVCTENDFAVIQDRFGYVSYKFKPRNLSLTGASHGLKININTSTINETTNTKYLGLRIIVHSHNNDPEFYSGGSDKNIDIPTGFFSNIVIRRTFAEKLGQPYNDCLKDVKSLESFNSDLYRYILQSTEFAYCQKDCLQLCLGREYYKFLNVTKKIDYFLNSLREMNNMLSNEFFKIYDALISNVCLPLCPLECDSMNYDMSLSMMKFTNNNENLIGFNAYYYDSTLTFISELEKFNFLDLISSIGGNLGLFIGVSFLSFAEFIEYLVEIYFILF
jgi:hypothetical protein